ncbi:RNA-directed DNA polymerase, eukaryota [Tanacetum coccineum]
MMISHSCLDLKRFSYGFVVEAVMMGFRISFVGFVLLVVVVIDFNDLVEFDTVNSVNTELTRSEKKKKALFFKVDFAKAYDSVRWDFLLDVLEAFGFGSTWCTWIRGISDFAKASLLVNGSPSDEFHIHRGLKQGDPLSPFLFILVMEALHLSVCKAVDEDVFKGIQLQGRLSSNIHKKAKFWVWGVPALEFDEMASIFMVANYYGKQFRLSWGDRWGMGDSYIRLWMIVVLSTSKIPLGISPHSPLSSTGYRCFSTSEDLALVFLGGRTISSFGVRLSEWDEWSSHLYYSSFRVQLKDLFGGFISTFAVPAYQDAGGKCNRYDLARVGYRQRRCLILPFEFLPNLQNNQVAVMVSGIRVSTVTQRTLVLPRKRQGHVFSGHGWNILVAVENLQIGTKIVFTNLLNNTVLLVPFDDSGIALSLENVPTMPLNQDILFVRRPHDKDKRMEHGCDWVNHEQHENEERCFYSLILAYVTARKRLTIPWWLSQCNSPL